MLVVVNPRHQVKHPDKARRYEFCVVGIDRVRVRKFEFNPSIWDEEIVEQREMNRQAAAKLWSWLKKIGYVDAPVENEVEKLTREMDEVDRDVARVDEEESVARNFGW